MPAKTKRRSRTSKRAAASAGKRPARIREPIRPTVPDYSKTDTYNGMRGKNWDSGWKFHLGEVEGAADPALNDSSWRKVDLPHDWSIEFPFRADSPAGTGGGFLDGGIGWYRKTFTAPGSWSGKRIVAGFDGAYMDSKVWLNGKLLGARPYGYISFGHDLTPHLKIGERNTIAVRLENDQPTSRWYSGSGIYRNVWLTVLHPLHVDWCGLFVSTPKVKKDTAVVRVKVRVCNRSDAATSASLRMKILAPGGKRAGSHSSGIQEVPSGGAAEFEEEIPVPNPKLWSVEEPNCYELHAEVLSGGRKTDSYRTAFGIRTFAFDPDEGFSLNGRWMKLNGVCLHHDLGALGAAVNARAIRRQLEIMKAMGCNAVRTSHNPPDPILLDLCDRMGLLVIDEAFDAWVEGNKAANDYHRFFEAWAQTDLQDMVRRDRNHPCIILYSIGNEIHDITTAEGVALTRRMAGWVRAEDSTRPVTHGSNYMEVATEAAGWVDVVGYNYHTHLYDLHHAEFPRWKMYASETSSAVRTRGVYKFPAGENLLMGEDLQCSSYDNSVVEWGISAEESWRRVNSRKFIAGEFIWSGFDYLGEPTPYEWPAKSSYFGIVDTCGFPKDIYYFYQSRWTERPMVHLLPHWNWRKGESVPVWAYTNCDEVELFQDGVSLGKRRFEPDGPLHLEWEVLFREGVLEAVGKRGGEVAARDEIRTAGTPAAVRLSADRTDLLADGEDMAFVTVEIVDARGVVVPDAGNPVRFHITGPGRLAGVDNGDPVCRESHQGKARSAFHGKCLAIVRSSGRVGKISLEAASEGLKPGTITIKAEK